MSTHEIKVKKGIADNGKTIPELEHKKQLRKEVKDGDYVKWKYKKGKTITISSKDEFAPGSKRSYSGDEKVKIQFGGATDGNDITLKYNIATSDTEEALDPVIIIKPE